MEERNVRIRAKKIEFVEERYFNMFVYGIAVCAFDIIVAI